MLLEAYTALGVILGSSRFCFDLLGPHHDLEDKSMVWNGWVRVKQTLTRVSVFSAALLAHLVESCCSGKAGQRPDFGQAVAKA